MSEQVPPRKMFSESRLMLGLLSPVLGVFFVVGVYFTTVWQPDQVGDRICKFIIADILFTFIVLCGVGIIASIVGPQRIRPFVLGVGGGAVGAGLVLILGTALYVLYGLLTSP